MTEYLSLWTTNRLLEHIDCGWIMEEDAWLSMREKSLKKLFTSVSLEIRITSTLNHTITPSSAVPLTPKIRNFSSFAKIPSIDAGYIDGTMPSISSWITIDNFWKRLSFVFKFSIKDWTSSWNQCSLQIKL